jgi:23S rRNA (guanosine2251-2'-O)-methyltransferase
MRLPLTLDAASVLAGSRRDVVRRSSTLAFMEVLYGLHPVEEALKAGRRRFDHVMVARERDDTKLERLVALCRDCGVRVRQETREQLTQLAQTSAHQGVVALVHGQEFLAIEDLYAPATAGAARLLLALDGVEDPQNLGALLRVADGAGVDGVLLTERRSAPLSPVAVKASAGAAEHLRIARVVNLVRALEELKRQNLWIIGLDERGTCDYDQFDLTGNCVLVMGREGDGLHELVRRTCDHLLRIPMAGGVSSLNVSAAGAVVLYEASASAAWQLAALKARLSLMPQVERLNQGNRKAWAHEALFSPHCGKRRGYLSYNSPLCRANHTCHTTGIGNASFQRPGHLLPFHRRERRDNHSNRSRRCAGRRRRRAGPAARRRASGRHLYSVRSRRPP